MSDDSLPFSQREGFIEIEKKFQKESIDTPLRNALWNALYRSYFQNLPSSSFKDHTSAPDIWIKEDSYIGNFYRELMELHYKKTVDDLDYWWPTILSKLKGNFLGCRWHDAYDFIEFTYNHYRKGDEYLHPEFEKQCNNALEREGAAYRFVGGKITPITSKEEMQEITEAMNSPLDTVNLHFKTALTHLSDKTEPDFRNSIKESISAVESICKKIVGNENTTLGAALKEIQEKGEIEIHEDMKEAFQKLYGYTSDAGGIRHSMMDGKIKPDFDDAKFMLVSCSAFVNYLVSKSSKAGINLK